MHLCALFAFLERTNIQSWPIAVKGSDMICIAKTGSGKTCGFLLPSLHQFIQAGGRPKNQRPGNMAENGPVLLVLAPTRELACQIMDESQRFGRSCGARTICCYGGSNKFPQIAAFERGIEVVIATPGRLNDLLEMKKADLSRVKFLVLDEAGKYNNNERSLFVHSCWWFPTHIFCCSTLIPYSILWNIFYIYIGIYTTRSNVGHGFRATDPFHCGQGPGTKADSSLFGHVAQGDPEARS